MSRSQPHSQGIQHLYHRRETPEFMYSDHPRIISHGCFIELRVGQEVAAQEEP